VTGTAGAPAETTGEHECATRQETIDRKQVEERAAVLTEELAEANDPLASTEKSLEERLRFEALLTDISARFVNLPGNQVEFEIGDVQCRVCECLDLDL
jgi:hypothetical protein